MAVEPYIVVDTVTDDCGLVCEVGTDGEGVIVRPYDPVAVVTGMRFSGGRRDRFAEAVARAVTPGRVPVKHGPGCRCTPCLAEPSYRARRQVTP